MKAQVDIVTGFLGSGKTTLINNMLKNNELNFLKTIIIQNEQGNTDIDRKLLEEKNIRLFNIGKNNQIDVNFLLDKIEHLKPDKIIIENNALESTENLLKLFDDPIIRNKCRVNCVYNNIVAPKFNSQINGSASIFSEQIKSCNTIIIRRTQEIPFYQIKEMEKIIKSINKNASIIWLNKSKKGMQEPSLSPGGSLDKSKKSKKKRINKVGMGLLIIISAYILYSMLRIIGGNWHPHIDLAKIQVLVTVFISILIQAFPFILVGVLVSSIIHVLVPGELITKLFRHKSILGYLVAIFSGILFPVCDCAVVPVAQRLVRKGVPVSVAVTFMLSAPIVNPIVIASTFYAFPGQPTVAVFRVLFGIIVALGVGIFLSMSFIKKDQILLEEHEDHDCDCGFCEDEDTPDGLKGKIEEIFKHAGSEFFNVGKYIVIGALLSSALQTFVPKAIFTNIAGGFMISLLIMMLLAFILSVCSTSDAFIARTFVRQFTLGSVMGFMVLGPMIDIKNVLMLLGNFKKKFVAMLVILIFVMTFLVLCNLASMIY